MSRFWAIVGVLNWLLQIFKRRPFLNKHKHRQQGAVVGVSCLRVMLRLLRPASARNAARLRFVSRSVSSAIPTAAGDDFTKLKVAQLKEELDKLHVPHGHLKKKADLADLLTQSRRVAESAPALMQAIRASRRP